MPLGILDGFKGRGNSLFILEHSVAVMWHADWLVDIGRTPRSNVATYTGLFDHVRRRFADAPEARSREYKSDQFSFNVAGGRCPTCEGEGSVMVELLFLPSVYPECPDCHGTRYKASTLEVTWRWRTVADVLSMSVEEANLFFVGDEEITRSPAALSDVGLDDLRQGQPATELSGERSALNRLPSCSVGTRCTLWTSRRRVFTAPARIVWSCIFRRSLRRVILLSQ